MMPFSRAARWSENVVQKLFGGVDRPFEKELAWGIAFAVLGEELLSENRGRRNAGGAFKGCCHLAPLDCVLDGSIKTFGSACTQFLCRFEPMKSPNSFISRNVSLFERRQTFLASATLIVFKANSCSHHPLTIVLFDLPMICNFSSYNFALFSLEFCAGIQTPKGLWKILLEVPS